MTPITLQRAYELIQQSIAVVVDMDALAYPALDVLTGAPENEWLYLSWDEGNNEPRSIRFIEEDQTITFDGTTITMQDSEGETFTLTLLTLLKTEP